jgi:hypothetical protein
MLTYTLRMLIRLRISAVAQMRLGNSAHAAPKTSKFRFFFNVTLTWEDPRARSQSATLRKSMASLHDPDVTPRVHFLNLKKGAADVGTCVKGSYERIIEMN